MKKIVLFLFVAIATLSVKAQDLYMGGTVGLWRNDDANTTSFKLAPEIGYNLSEQWALGVELQFNHEYKEHISTNTFAIAPYARFNRPSSPKVSTSKRPLPRSTLELPAIPQAK